MLQDNPPGYPEQELIGTCEAMCPAAFVEDCTSSIELVDGEPVYAIKQFKRSVNEQVGNVGPAYLRTKRAIHNSMETLRAWQCGFRCAASSPRRPSCWNRLRAGCRT